MIPQYFLLWTIALGVALAAADRRARRHGLPRVNVMFVVAACALVLVIGSKLLYLAEAHWAPTDDYVPRVMRGRAHGFRIPGGIAALALSLPSMCFLAGMDWRRFGDAMAELPSQAIVFVRLGCFLNGCCFGRLSDVPWAVTFPPGSWAYWYQEAHGLVPRNAPRSLPVHPLQLYFLVAALGAYVVLRVCRTRGWPPGRLQLISYTMFFSTTALLEPLRANPLHLNMIIVQSGSAVCIAWLIGESLWRWSQNDRHNETAVRALQPPS